MKAGVGVRERGNSRGTVLQSCVTGMCFLHIDKVVVEIIASHLPHSLPNGHRCTKVQSSSSDWLHSACTHTSDTQMRYPPGVHLLLYRTNGNQLFVQWGIGVSADHQCVIMNGALSRKKYTKDSLCINPTRGELASFLGLLWLQFSA